MLSYPLVEGREPDGPEHDPCSACAAPGALNPGTCPFLPTDRIVDGVIQEINARGNLVWDWHAEPTHPRHAIRRSPTGSRTSRSTTRRPQAGVVDLHHLNALQRIDDGTGDYLVTARHLDAAFRVDRSTENVEWYRRRRARLCTSAADPSAGCRSSAILSAGPNGLTTPGSTATC